MPRHFPENRRVYLFATALSAFCSLAMMWAMVCYLRDAALAAVPFGGHTVPLGTEYVWANRIAMLFLIVSCALLAHALARIFQLTVAWRQRALTS